MVLVDDFAHRIRYLLAGKILQWLAVAAAVIAEAVPVLEAGWQALPNSLQHVEEEEVEGVGYLLHTHKASQPDQQTGHIDSLLELQEIMVEEEVAVVVVKQQRDLAFGWFVTWVATSYLMMQVQRWPLVAVVEE